MDTVKRLPLIDEQRFHDEVLKPYREGHGFHLPVSGHDEAALLPAGTATTRDLGYVASEMPVLDASRCTACMDCVAVCPDSALLARLIPERETQGFPTPLVRTRKFWELPPKRGLAPALFGLFVDPARCKGCGECAEVCADKALTMHPKDALSVDFARRTIALAQALPDPPEGYVQDRIPADWMLEARSLLYAGGAGSCRGCGEATTIRMMLAATGHAFGAQASAIVAATGCNSVFGATWPYNPFRVPWANSLFENAPAVAMGLRARWNQMGWRDKKLWVVGGDGALCDIGFGSLSRVLASGLDINVLVLDTQVYSNTGGQASTATFLGQDAKMASFGREQSGKTEARKELGLLAIAHGDVFVAQTTPAHLGHFYRSIVDANTFKGPSVVNVYCPCQPEHGIPDDATSRQAKLAVTARAFPLFTYDPRKGDTLRARLSLQGNPSVDSDWHVNKNADETTDFVAFARTEGRFAKQFDAEGHPSPALLRAKDERLRNWHRLRELAGAARTP